MLAKGIIIRMRNTYLGRFHFWKGGLRGRGGGGDSSPSFKLNYRCIYILGFVRSSKLRYQIFRLH